MEKVKVEKRDFVDFGIGSWKSVKGWDEVESKINMMAEEDWGIVFFNPNANEVFINAPLKRGKGYILNQEVDNFGVFTINGPVDVPYIGVALAIGVFERARAGLKIGCRGVIYE